MAPSNTRSDWLMLAIASGACAACNGVFAKLTTTELTASWANIIADFCGIDPSHKLIEYSIRGLFFGLNLIFNGVMWGLFTRALTLASSTVRVSIINTSANFMVTAVLGALVFSEKLPALWWLGAAMLVSGSVIIGMREETEKGTVTVAVEHSGLDIDDRVTATEEKIELRGARNRAGYKTMEARSSE